MSKLTPPAPQHPFRRWKFYKEHYGDCATTMAIEKKHPNLFKTFSKPKVIVEEKKESIWQMIINLLKRVRYVWRIRF